MNIRIKKTIGCIASALLVMNMFSTVGFADDDITAEEEAYFAKFIDGDTEIVEFFDGCEPYEADLVPDRMMLCDDDFDFSLPSYYDTRDHYTLPSVRSQGSTGTCWAHSAIGLAEINAIVKGLRTQYIDYSEAQLTWFSFTPLEDTENNMYLDDYLSINGYSDKAAYVAYVAEKNNKNYRDIYDVGGNFRTASAVLSSLTGPMFEDSGFGVEDRPYEDVMTEDMRFKSDLHISNYSYYDEKDTDSIKNAIMKYGAVGFSYYNNGNYTNKHFSKTYTAYYQYAKETTSHAIIAVGWDDDFSRDNFKSPTMKPEHDGAWICRNSWGKDFGVDGYFYLSYDDPSFSRVWSLEVSDKKEYGSTVYQYDYCVSGVPGKSSTSYGFTAANIYTSVTEEPIGEVGFVTYDASSPYTVEIYSVKTNDRPTSGTLLASVEGYSDYAGYTTVKLPEPVSVPIGTKFSVVVNLKDTVVLYDHNSVGTKLSYSTNNDPHSLSTTWAVRSKANYCIKAFTVKDGAPIVDTEPTFVMVWDGEQAEIEVKAEGENLSYQWYSSPDLDSWEKIENATEAKYSFKADMTDNYTFFFCEVSNEKYTVNSGGFMLTVRELSSLTEEEAQQMEDDECMIYLKLLEDGDSGDIMIITPPQAMVIERVVN